MAILRCKMCGGDIEIIDSQNIGVCEYCGCSVTIPKYDSEYTLSQFNTANDYRIAGEFERAGNICESIIVNDPTNAEAYWCALLSKYGIEYVEDAVTMDRIPTCHRILKESILEDVNYKKAIEFSDGISKRIYEKEARKINELLKNVIAISEREEPYDIFISYKENDEFGCRTLDSVLAHDLYNSLTKEGYRVFFSKISLEDKLGEEYEPYIYAALNSAKVMFLIGTCRENIESTWVKNEWSRFQKLTKNDTSKKLIPCYKDMQVNELPEEVSILQAQDLNRLGAIQDILHGLRKVFNKEIMPISSASTEKVDGRIVRAFQLLEDGEFYQAKDLLNVILEDDVNCAKAYIGLLLCDLRLCTESELVNICYDEELMRNRHENQHYFWGLDKNFMRAKEVAQPDYKAVLEEYEIIAKKRYMKISNLETVYEDCVEEFIHPNKYTFYDSLLNRFAEILCRVGSWKETDKYYEACKEKIEEEKKQQDEIKNSAVEKNIQAQNKIVFKNGVLAGIQGDGTVKICGNESLSKSVSTWKNIISIDLSDDGKLLVGLNKDGRFLSTSSLIMRGMGLYKYIDVKAGSDCVIGLREDKTIYGIINGMKYEPEWCDIEKITCNKSLVLVLTEKGKAHSNNADYEENFHFCLGGFKDIMCENGEAYLITEDNYVHSYEHMDKLRHLEDIVKIKVFDENLYAVNMKGVLISPKPTAICENYKEYTWGSELIDFAVVGDILYGVGYDGSFWKSKKIKEEGVTLLRAIKVESIKEKVVALFVDGNEFVQVYADGTVYSNKRDLSSWNLFEDTRSFQKNTISPEYQKIEFEIENHEGKTSQEMADDLMSGIVFLLDENIKKASEIVQKEPEKRQAYEVELKNMYVIYRQIMEQTGNLDDRYKGTVEEKTEQLKRILDIAMKMEDKEEANKTCRNCGNELRVGKKFCSKCGTRVDE